MKRIYTLAFTFFLNQIIFGQSFNVPTNNTSSNACIVGNSTIIYDGGGRGIMEIVGMAR